MRLLIAIPCGDTVRYEFCESLTKLCQHLAEEGVDYDIKFWEGSLIYDAREGLAIFALDNQYSHILWLDSDVQFSIDTFDILNAMGKDFVTGIYRSRRCPYAVCLFDSIKNGTRVIEIPNEPFEVEACGFGCVLMTRDVLHKLRRIYGKCFTPTDAAGEDIAFCQRWIDLGFKIYANPDVKVNHITYIALKPSDATKLTEYKELI